MSGEGNSTASGFKEGFSGNGQLPAGRRIHKATRGEPLVRADLCAGSPSGLGGW